MSERDSYEILRHAKFGGPATFPVWLVNDGGSDGVAETGTPASWTYKVFLTSKTTGTPAATAQSPIAPRLVAGQTNKATQGLGSNRGGTVTIEIAYESYGYNPC